MVVVMVEYWVAQMGFLKVGGKGCERAKNWVSVVVAWRVEMMVKILGFSRVVWSEQLAGNEKAVSLDF